MTTKKPKHAPPSRPVVKGQVLSQKVNPRQLLTELHAQLKVTGVLQRQSNGSIVLAIAHRPKTVTDAHLQAVIAAHKSTAATVPEQLARWSTLTPTDKDALLLAMGKKLYGIR